MSLLGISDEASVEKIAPQNTDEKSIAEISREVVDKHGGGRGGARPGAGRKKKSDAKNVGTPDPESKAETPYVASPDDVAFVRETVASALQLVNKLMTRRVLKVCHSLEIPESKAQEFAATVEIESSESELVGKAAGACAAKYGFVTRFAPEIFLGGWAVSYGLRCNTTLSQLDKLAKDVAALKVKHAAAS
jgi:hypothetical protein